MGSNGRFEYAVTDDAGLHARPAANFARFAQSLASSVTASAGGKTVDAKSMIAVMSLGVHTGDVVTVELEGENAADEGARFAAWCAENI